MRRVSVLALAALALCTGAARAEWKQIPVVRLHATAQVAAPPAAVWAQLTHGRNLVTWCPMWKAPANAAVNLVRVGDALDFTDPWGNGGRSVVTFLAPGRELRVAHEPAKGDYLCQAKITLAPADGGTLVHYWEQYTDESGPGNLKATAAKVEADMAATLESLRHAAERK
ncbi:MAG TPA: SRPBCC family protein [Candidatus Eisenbacteria bacterium]|nr:SRPBCC family protein [Candidatus Eisenbacteria bacterium]